MTGRRSIGAIIGVILLMMVVIPTTQVSAATLTIQSSTKDLTYGDKCTADWGGKDGSTWDNVIRPTFCWIYCWSRHGLLEFDLTPISSIPASNIISAELHLYEYASSSSGGSPWTYNFEVEVYPNTGPWDEATTWYYTVPGFDAGYSNKILITEDLGWRVWNVTDIVRDWQDGVIPNYGFRIFTLDDDSVHHDLSALFYTRETGGELAPKLVIEYCDASVDITEAQYDYVNDLLSVKATSTYGASDALEVEGYGPMFWNENKGVWELEVLEVMSPPEKITVNGIQGCKAIQ